MEEDIKILEKTIEIFNSLKEINKCVRTDEIELMNSIENLIKGYRKLEQQNKELKINTLSKNKIREK